MPLVGYNLKTQFSLKKNWDIIDVQDYISFRCTTQGFNICIYCEMFTDNKSS